jgi:hypothetical protein
MSIDFDFLTLLTLTWIFLSNHVCLGVGMLYSEGALEKV